jgi:hypothetical protein
VTRSGQSTGSGQREQEHFYYNLLLINQRELNGLNKKSFFFYFLVSKILGFDLHFMFVLSLDCDDSWMKEGVVKIFGFDV